MNSVLDSVEFPFLSPLLYLILFDSMVAPNGLGFFSAVEI